MSAPTKIFTPDDFNGDFGSPAKRKKANNVQIRPATHRNKLFVYLTQAGVEVWSIETSPGIDGEIAYLKHSIDSGHNFTSQHNFKMAVKRRLNRSTNYPAGNNCQLQRAATETEGSRYVFVRIVDDSSASRRCQMATKLIAVRSMVVYVYHWNNVRLTVL